MDKPLKVMSKATLAALFTATAIVPTAVMAAETPDNEVATKVDKVIFIKGEENLSLELKEYAFAFAGKKLDKSEKVQILYADDKKYYDVKDYAFAFASTKNPKEAFAKIAEKGKELSDVKEGKIVDGFVVAKDEQPEDRLNETFFYNFAA